MKGRNTFVVGLRFPDDAFPLLKARADRHGKTISTYIRDQVLLSIHSVNTMPPKKPHTAMDEIMALPEFNPAIHKKGDHVRVFDQFRESWSRLIV